LIDKRADYAAAGIPEYWIIDPRDQTVLILGLLDGSYQELNAGTRAEVASSRLLDGFQIDVRRLFQEASQE